VRLIGWRADVVKRIGTAINSKGQLNDKKRMSQIEREEGGEEKKKKKRL